MDFVSLEEALDYLKSLNGKELIDDLKSYRAILYLADRLGITNFDIYLEKNAEKIFSNILIELYNISTEFDFSNFKIEINKIPITLTKNDQRISIFSFTQHILNVAFRRSIKFAKKFSIQKGLEALSLYLKDKTFIERTKNVDIIDLSGNPLNVIFYITLNVYILSKTCDDHLQLWIDLNIVDALLDVANKLPITQLDAYLTICNIANDKQIESLVEIHKIIKIMMKKINECAEDFSNGIFYRGDSQIIENDQIMDVDVHFVTEDNGITSSILVYLKGLYNLSINDKLRSDIYFNENSKNDLKILLLKGNDTEMKYTLKLYAQLSFNPSISVDNFKQEDLMAFLKNLLNNKKKDINDLVKQILWNIDQNSLKISNENSEEKQIISPSNKNDHIMISYNSASRELCLRIKSILESNGHKVWIDVGNIHGSSLDSMAKAVEDSFCVLVCITEKYRQSVNCQAEAQYAFKLNKPIIPLIMQKGYENVKGWLGIIISDKIFVNFTKYDFDECIKRLKHEIDSISGNQISTKIFHRPASVKPPNKSINSNHDIKINQTNNNKTNTESNLVSNWDENEVSKWLESKNMNGNLNELLPCNGLMLKQLYEMRRDAPEFYFQSLKSYNIDFKSILLFTEYLNNLFLLN